MTFEPARIPIRTIRGGNGRNCESGHRSTKRQHQIMIRMPDGVRMSAADFHRLKTAGHKESHYSNAESFVARFRNAIPEAEWHILKNWMLDHSGAVPLTSEREAHFLIVLAKHVGRDQREIPQVINRIIQRGSAVGTFITKM